MDKIELTEQYELFCKEYIVDFNGTKAAIRAEYSEKTAAQQASRLLRNVNIQKRIKQLLEKRSSKIEITAERVLEEIATLAFSNIPDYFKQIGTGQVLILTLKQFEDMPEDVTRAISSLEQNVDKEGNIIYKLRLWDKSKNLEMLCKHLGITADTFNIKASPDLLVQLAKIRIAEDAKKKEE